MDTIKQLYYWTKGAITLYVDELLIYISETLEPQPQAMVQVYKDKAGKFRWRIVSANGKILAVSSESYKNRADLDKALEVVRSSK